MLCFVNNNLHVRTMWLVLNDNCEGERNNSYSLLTRIFTMLCSCLVVGVVWEERREDDGYFPGEIDSDIY